MLKEAFQVFIQELNASELTVEVSKFTEEVLETGGTSLVPGRVQGLPERQTACIGTRHKGSRTCI